MTERIAVEARKPGYSFEKKKYQVTVQEVCALLGITVPQGAKVSVSSSPSGDVVIEITKEIGRGVFPGSPLDPHSSISCRSSE